MSNNVFIYDNYKLSHSGITKYTTYEGIYRKIKHKSLQNLLNYTQITGEILTTTNEAERTRHLNPNQSRKIKQTCNKLSYYSKQRKFTSKKSGAYKMKVSFITLTAPELTTHTQFLLAFDYFLDYLRRTANCVFIYKKELGEKNKHLHVHIMINNFIPYYIVSWKWKRLLLAQNVVWPLNEKGEQSSSHSRIELPRNDKHTGHYLSKYMSKAYDLPKECGLIWGKSEIFNTLKETVLIESDIEYSELEILKAHGKLVGDQFVSHLCIDLLTVKEFAPKLFAVFQIQFNEFQRELCLPQHFFFID